jgi:hypothetical protein
MSSAPNKGEGQRLCRRAEASMVSDKAMTMVSDKAMTMVCDKATRW